MSTTVQNKLRLPLFLCRFGIFAVFFAWTWDKIFNASHGAGVFNRFYGIEITNEMTIGLGVLEAVFIFIFLFGFYKRIARALMILFSGVTTFALGDGYMAFFNPNNFTMDRRSGFFVEFLLVPTFAMFVCAIIVYALRDYDTLFSFSKKDRALNA